MRATDTVTYPPFLVRKADDLQAVSRQRTEKQRFFGCFEVLPNLFCFQWNGSR
jgi:hypothetical protein